MCMLGSVAASSQGGHAKNRLAVSRFSMHTFETAAARKLRCKETAIQELLGCAMLEETSVVSSLDDLHFRGLRFDRLAWEFQHRSRSVSDDRLREADGWKDGGLASCSHIRRHGSTASPSRAAREVTPTTQLRASIIEVFTSRQYFLERIIG
jgi:hypothetical protein